MEEIPRHEQPSTPPMTNTEIHLGALVSPVNKPEAIRIMRLAAEALAKISIDNEVTAWQVPLPAYSGDVSMPPVRSQAEQAGQQQRTMDMARECDLTTRELEIALLIGRGVDKNAEIGARLFLSADTVKTHKARLYAKTGAKSHNDIMRLLGVLPEA